MINEIAALPKRVVLVLDDYHLMDAQPIHDALAFLLRHLPSPLHLAIATRKDPPLPLARLCASEWYERNGFADDATEHALSAVEAERAARLIGAHADTLWVLGEHDKLKRWLVRLPEIAVL